MFEWLSSYLLLLSILGAQPLVAEPVSPTVAETLTQAIPLKRWLLRSQYCDLNLSMQ